MLFSLFSVAFWFGLTLRPSAPLVLPLAAFHPQQLLQSGLTWIDGLGPIAAIAFIGVYGLATVALFPGSILTFGAGVLFGVVWGSIYVFLGATLGATAAFLIGRYLARAWVKQKIARYPKFQAIDHAVQREGLKIVLLTRLSPAFPFVVINYAYGITGVRLRDYLWGCLGMIPGTVVYVYFGSLAGSLATLGTTTTTHPGWQWALRGVGLLITLGGAIYMGQVARRALAAEMSPDGE